MVMPVQQLARYRLNPPPERVDGGWMADLRKALMSELGQSRRFDVPPVISGLPPQTDINLPTRLVRFVPIAEIGMIP
jgi:hypothetical protein